MKPVSQQTMFHNESNGEFYGKQMNNRKTKSAKKSTWQKSEKNRKLNELWQKLKTVENWISLIFYHVFSQGCQI